VAGVSSKQQRKVQALMQVIEGVALSRLVDYNFGDHLAVWDSKLEGEFEVANCSNLKFLSKCKEFEGRVMTVFIDNIRLYTRSLDFSGPNAEGDSKFIAYLMQNNDLLELVKMLPKNKFLIFTSNEDTALDDTIQVPDNVVAIYAINGASNNDKVHPLPLGLQRKRNPSDNRLSVMAQRIKEDKRVKASKLLYINCGIERNPERIPLGEFKTNDWCTTRFDKNSMFFPYDKYDVFLDELQDHKFVACPKGQSRGKLDCFDTHRLWETLYMRRVPVILNHPYFHKLLKGFPVLFVDSWSELNKELLEANGDLYQKAQEMDLERLNLDKIWASIVSRY